MTARGGDNGHDARPQTEENPIIRLKRPGRPLPQASAAVHPLNDLAPDDLALNDLTGPRASIQRFRPENPAFIAQSGRELQDGKPDLAGLDHAGPDRAGLLSCAAERRQTSPQGSRSKSR